jgi:hypothetical protein
MPLIRLGLVPLGLQFHALHLLLAQPVVGFSDCDVVGQPDDPLLR